VTRGINAGEDDLRAIGSVQRQGRAIARAAAGAAARRDQPGLEDLLRSGIVRRGQALAWADSPAVAQDAPGSLGDLTGWECAHSSFHLEDLVPVDRAIIDDAPVISEAGQRTLLIHGLNFSLRFASLVHGLAEPRAVRCIIGANDSNATFRFHQIHPGERWNQPDLDVYNLDKMIATDVEPAARA
jgi:hypothetical protein